MSHLNYWSTKLMTVEQGSRMRFSKSIIGALLAILAGSHGLSTLAFAESQDDRFKDVEIRVIRPKFFSKRKRFELGADFSVISNQTFIYSYLLTGNATFHLTETWAIEGAGSYGFSIDKADKRDLDSEFSIKTEILRTKYMLDGALLWSPIYGKYQLASGRLIYFDTFLIGGLGMSGVEYKYDNCEAKTDTANPQNNYVVPSPQTKGYLSYVWGLGQRYFVNQTTSLKWSVRGHRFNYSKADGACNKETAPSGTDVHHNIVVQLGASKFF